VNIGRRSFIGIGAVIPQGIAVGEDALLGAGALLLHSLADRTVAYGSPARVVRSRAEDEPYF
jgi:acetyltransferase-like isoleucine patch superfamily enzyme